MLTHPPKQEQAGVSPALWTQTRIPDPRDPGWRGGGEGWEQASASIIISGICCLQIYDLLWNKSYKSEGNSDVFLGSC